MKIRRISAEERADTTFAIQAYAFEPSPAAPPDLAEFRRYAPYAAEHRCLIVADGDTTLATATAIPMRQNVRGTAYPMAGIAGVTTHPLARRQGHVRRLMLQLLGEMRDEGHPVSALYPFRPSFYERFGYVGLPKARRVAIAPADLAPMIRADLPGELSWQRIREGYDGYRELTNRLCAQRHGFALFPDYQAVRLRDLDDRWLVTARVDGEVVGAVTYRCEQHGGDLVADDLLATGPLGRALLLRFFAHHADQVARILITVPADETPELWLTDLAAHTEARVAFPTSSAPMARVLSLDGLAGMAVGAGRVRIEIVDDPFIAGTYLLDGAQGRLDVTSGGVAATTTLTAAGLSGLVYGVLDPADVVIRGLGTVPDGDAIELGRLFPRRTPHLSAEF